VKGVVDYDDLVYGHDKLSDLVEKHPEIKDGLTRFLFEIILRRMEVMRSLLHCLFVCVFDIWGFL
jgi:hypothetical protein